MKEYVFDELGYFSKETCEKVKKAMEGRTYMNFFDFEAFGRDMDGNGHFIETDSGYIEIFN